MDTKHFLVMALVCGLADVVLTQSEPSVSDVLDQLPPEFQDKVNASDIESIKNKSQELFKEKCEKNGGAEAFASAQKAYKTFPKCVQDALDIHDPSKIQLEIEAAKPNGTVDEVFKKYCQKTPEAKKCFMNMTESIKPCFSAEEQKNLKVVYNISEQLAEFICFKDGDRIALFIAEGGPECFESKKDQIQDCVHKTFGDQFDFNPANLTAGNISTSSIPEINFGEKECKQLSDLQVCVVGALEKCAAPTSANIVESLFKFARQATPCKTRESSEAKPRSQVQGQDTKPNSASGVALSTITFLVALSAALY